MYGYQPFGTAKQMMMSPNPDVHAMGHNIAGAYGRDLQREKHEQGLQAQEQQRRLYDSQTQRQKLGLLSGLLGTRTISG